MNHLEALSQWRGRWRLLGYEVRDTAFFAAPEVWVYTRSMPLDGIATIERAVYVYAVGDAWQLRITSHGASEHWVKSARTHDLELLVQAVLEGRDAPPAGWTPV